MIREIGQFNFGYILLQLLVLVNIFLRFSSTPMYPTTAHVYRYYWEHDSIKSLTWSNTLIPMDDIMQTWVCSSYGYKDCKHIWLTIF